MKLKLVLVKLFITKKWMFAESIKEVCRSCQVVKHFISIQLIEYSLAILLPNYQQKHNKIEKNCNQPWFRFRFHSIA